MKKLMTMLAAAAMAFGLYADPVDPQSDGFEAAGWEVTGNWSTNGEAVVTQGDWKGETRTTSLPYSFDTVGNNYLTVKTPIKVDEGLAWANNTDTDKTIGDGIYFDGLINFTNCEDPVEVEVDDGTKLVVYTVESETEGSDATKTNLYVSAGFWNGNAWEAKAYDCGSLDNYNIADCNGTGFWRVTIRSLADISEGSDVNPGFLVFVNSKGAAREEEIGFANLNSTAAAWASKNNLFPSLVQDPMDQSALTTINAVAFAGQGAIDDVVITRNEPADFVKDEFFTLSLGDHVASLKYTVNGGAEQTLDSDSAVLPYVQNMKVVVTAVTYEAGEDPKYDRGDWKLNGVTITGNTFEPQLANLTGVVNGKDVTERILVDGVGYPTFKEAIAALATAETKKLTLNKDVVTVGYDEEAEVTEAFIDAGDDEVVLDLAGKTLNGANIDGNFVVIGSGNLTIVDSSNPQTGKIVAGEDDAGAVRIQSNSPTEAATLTIEGGIFEGAVVILKDTAGLADATAAIFGGKFDEGTNTDNNKFTLEAFVDESCDLTNAGGYWVVTPATIWTVTFYNGEDVFTTQEVRDGELATKPETDPEKDYYTFGKWTTDGTAEFDFATTPITANTSLIATWTANEYTVTWTEESGEYTNKVETFTYDTYESLKLADGDTREGYTFEGWTDTDYNALENDTDVVALVKAKVDDPEADDLSIEVWGSWTEAPTDVDITLPETLPTGVESLVVSQQVEGVWYDVTETKKIGVGNEYVVVAIPAAGYKAENPIVEDTAEKDTPIIVTKEQVEAKIAEITYVAQIGEDGEKFETLQAAFDAAVNGNTINILDDINTAVKEQISIAGSDAKGHGDNFAITIVNNKTVTFASMQGGYNFLINDAKVTFAGTGTWQKYADDDAGSMIQIGNTVAANVIVNGGTFKGGSLTAKTNQGPSNLLQVKGGTLTFNDGYMLNERVNNARCIRADNPGTTVTINGGKFENLASTNGVFATGDTLALPVAAGKQDVGTVVIPSTSTAWFSADESHYVTEKGYGTVPFVDEAKTWYKYGKLTYAVDVEGGTADPTSYQISDTAQTVTLAPGQAPEGKLFEKWDVVATTSNFVNSTTFTDTKTNWVWIVSTNVNITVAGNEVTIPANEVGNIVATALYTNLQVTATFVDGETETKVVGDYGFTPDAPDAKGKEGYTFTGWNPEVAAIKADATFTAVYTPETYTITYTTGNGAVVTNGVTKYTIETDTFALPVAADIDMSKVEGVTFAGWTNATSEVVVTEVQKGTKGNLEFFAKWTAVVPEPTRPTPIEGGNEEQKKAYDDWAKTAGDVSGLSDAAIVDRFVMNVPAATTDVQLAAKADEELKSIADAALKAIMAGETPDLSALQKKYPNATIELVPSTKLTSTDTAKFYQLKFSFTSKN